MRMQDFACLQRAGLRTEAPSGNPPKAQLGRPPDSRHGRPSRACRSVRRRVPLLAADLRRIPGRIESVLAPLADVRAPRGGLLPDPFGILARAFPGQFGLAAARPEAIRAAPRLP